MNTKADCCATPLLSVIEVLEDDSGTELTIKKCVTCGTYWRVVVDQVKTEDSDIIEWDWYQTLTENQAEALLADAASK